MRYPATTCTGATGLSLVGGEVHAITSDDWQAILFCQAHPGLVAWSLESGDWFTVGGIA